MNAHIHKNTSSKWRQFFGVLLIEFFIINQCNAAIVANTAAPGNQQATVLPTASGIPQVNIQTPNGAGVSMNSYSQFNVSPTGVILNNSSSNVSTRLAGFITGNPNVANGPASIIVNQVVSPNPSTINGFVEVGGQKAEVVIANPSGISVNGGGFINTSRAVLTTGVPILNGSGQLTGYNVQDGAVSINGAGINYGDTPYATILARAVQINAQLLANDLTIITGANTIAVNSNDGTNAAFTASTQTPNSNKPVFALDASNLGSMYANKIFLLGTELGVGVNNAGTIGSTAGSFTLSNAGLITNSGALSSSNDLNVTAQGITNSGSVYAKNNLNVNSSAPVSNTSELAANQNATINVNGVLTNSGAFALIGAGLDSTGNFTNLSNSAGQNLTITSNGLTNSGNIYATNNTTIASSNAPVTNSGTGVIGSGVNLQLSSIGGDIANTGSILSSVSPTGAFNTGSAGNVAGNTTITTDSNINNQAGLMQSGGTTTINATGNLDNSAQGKIVSSSDLTIAAATVNNNTGNIATNSNLGMTTGNLTNNSGVVAALGTGANGNATINAANITNQAGYLQAAGNQTINSTGSIDSTGGFILSGGNQAINANTSNVANTINNTHGVLQASGTQAIGASDITNTSGTIASSGLTINANSLTGDGMVSSTQNAQINLIQSFNNQVSGTVQAGNNLLLATNGDLTNAGKITAVGTAGITAGAIGTAGITGTGAINNSNTLASGSDMTIVNFGALTNTGTIATNGKLTSTSGGSVDNGNLISVAGDAALSSTAGSITNSGNFVAGGNSTINSASTLNNTGMIGSNTNLTITAGDAVTNTSQMTAVGNLTLSSTSNVTNSGKIGANGTQSITSGGTVTNTGELSSNGNQTIHATGDIDNNANITSGALLTTNSVNLNNTGSMIGASINATATNSINNTGASALIGATDTNGTLQLLAPVITNTDPTTATDSMATTAIIGLGKVNLAGGVDSSGNLLAGNSVTNSSALIQSGGDLNIVATNVTNQRTSLVVTNDYATQLTTAQASAMAANANIAIQNGNAWNPANLSGTIVNPYDETRGTPALIQNQPGGVPPDTGCHGGGCNSNYYSTTYSGIGYSNTVQSISPMGIMQSGGNLNIIATNLTNLQSNIVATGNLNTGAANITNTAATVNGEILYSGSWTGVGYKGNFFGYGGGFSNVPMYMTYHTYTSNITSGGTLTNTGGSVNNGGSSGNSSTIGGSGSAYTPISNSNSGSLYAINPKGITVPSSGLYYPATNPSANYIIQTNPAFTNNQTWQSSSYMLTALSYDPSRVLKQIGDGYYEQALVAQQVTGLSGKSILAGYTNSEAQFIGLMNNGIAADQQFNFTLGVALTAAQIAALKSNIVWMVTENVTMPDGTVTQALVPQVYLAPGNVAVTGTGAVIAANNINMTNQASVNNSGAIVAQNNLLLQSNTDINSTIGSAITAGGTANLLANNNINLNQTNLAAGNLGLQAGQDLNIAASNVNVANNAQLTAGNDINIASKSSSFNYSNAGQTNGPSVAIVNVAQTTNVGSTINVGGQTQINATHDINNTGSIVNTGSAALSAGNNINLTASKDSSSFASNSGNSNLNEKVNAASINTTGALGVQATNDVNLTSSNLTSTNGAVGINAGNNINIGTMGESHNSTVVTSSESNGLLSSSKTTTTTINNSTTQIASNISGNSVNMTSGLDTNIAASNVIANSGGNIDLTAGQNLNILAGANTQLQQSSSQTSGGFLGHSGKSSDSQGQTTAASSQITGGDIAMQSGANTTLQATQITGNSLSINAGTINGQTINPNAQLNIDAAIESQNQSHTSQGSDLMTQNTANSGKVSQSLNYTTINLSNSQNTNQSPTLNATGGIVVGASNLPSTSTGSSGSGGSAPPTITVDLKQQAAQLSNQPGLSYLGDLTKRNDVTWQQVQLASQSWNYSQSGLSAGGAAIIAIAVAAVTAGAAAELSAAMVAGAGLTGTTATVASAALAAGMTSIASQAAVSLANNQGDIGKTLQDLGNSSAIRNTAAAMVTAGALAGLSNALASTPTDTATSTGSASNASPTTTFTGQSGAGSLTNSTSGIATSQALNDFTGNLTKNIANNLTGMVINSAITGKPLNEASLQTALASALITAGSAQAANSIGDATQSGALNSYTQAVAHAIAGCAGGAAAAGNGGGCGAGAVGAVVGELTAQYASSTGMTDPASITNLARVMSATAGLLVSNGDASAVNVAASMGANAAANNRMSHVDTFQKELAACQSNPGGNGCGTTLQMVQGTTPTPAGTNLNGYNATANVNASGTAMSYVVTDTTGNQLIMQPLEYQNFQQMNPVQQQSLMSASQASLDMSSAGQYLSASQLGAAASNFAHLNNQSSLGPVIDQTKGVLANTADAGSTALGVASIWSPPPIDVLAAGGALALKGTSYFLAPPSNSQIGYDIFSSAIPVFSPQTKGIQTGIAIGTAILQPVIVPQLEGNGKK